MAERIEELWVDTNDGLVNEGQYVETSETLEAGKTYRMIVDGNWNIFFPDTDLFGPARPAVMYPGRADERGDACLDAEARFGWPDASGSQNTGHHYGTPDGGIGGGNYVGHFLIDTDRTGYFHPEPIGGPFSTPQPGHQYVYDIEGAGFTVRAGIYDSFPGNSGQIRLRFFYFDATGWKVGSL